MRKRQNSRRDSEDCVNDDLIVGICKIFQYLVYYKRLSTSIN